MNASKDTPDIVHEAATTQLCVDTFTKKALPKPPTQPKLVPASRPTIISAIIDKNLPTLTAKNIPHSKPMERKKFDLKASLATHRPLNYKPYTGPLNSSKKDTTTTK